MVLGGEGRSAVWSSCDCGGRCAERCSREGCTVLFKQIFSIRESHSVGLTMEQTDIYIRIGKSWIFFVKKCFFGNFFWTVPF